MSPSAFAHPPHTVSEHMFIRMVDNPDIGGRLINAHWRVIHLGLRDGTLILSDRPLVRWYGYDHPKASWLLPLGPKAIFHATYCPADFDRVTPKRLTKILNVDSVKQAKKYVFCVDTNHDRLLEKYLSRKDGN